MAQDALFNKKYIGKQIAVSPAADPARLKALKDWAADIDSGKVASHNEVSLHGPFVQKVLVEGFGYRGPIGNDSYNVTQEKGITRGSVDVAIGIFDEGDGNIVAPFELKGADTKNLDAIMSGRAKTPVDQVWEYATKNPGSEWVLLSNYLEIRLYSYAEGRSFYERFDLTKLHEAEEFARAQLLLSAENLLSGRTQELLEESKRENKDITHRLYRDYKALRISLIETVRQLQADIDPLEAIRVGQTILDRVLFIAFAEDNSLLPKETLFKAYSHENPYDPQPVWNTFLRLFRAIDEGNKQLKIEQYNGGLFAPDERIIELAIPDPICEQFKALGEYDFASEVSVTVLGHIFEQSIADVEHLQAEARGEVVEDRKASGTSGRRKRDGVVYTPDYIARVIVEKTLGAHCREIFVELLAGHATKGSTPDDDPIAWKSVKQEKAFWQAYRERISMLRIVDPACGSGVFLVMAFDWLKDELMRCNTALERLGEGALFEPDSEILTHNLFGVDVNEESVEIAKLSLWIKTARHGKVLDSLDGNIRVGDSLIEDSSFAYREHGFVWKSGFPEVFAEGGFDVVLGNPPYVRMELLKALKPYLAKRFEVVSDRADLYAYFFERGIKILKPGGRLGYISSSTFFKTGSGAPLRDFLRTKATLETVVDFGDHQIFEGVTTFPAIITLRAGSPVEEHKLVYWDISDLPQESFDEAFEKEAILYPQKHLNAGTWKIENPELRNIRLKLLSSGRSLKETYGSPLYGVKTGLNAAFRLDAKTKNQICKDDPRSAELLHPLLEGKDVKRWIPDWRELWLIYIPKNVLEISNYPAIKKWLLPFKDKLEKRATKQEWFELQQAQAEDIKKLKNGAIIYSRFADKPNFMFSDGKFIINDAPYFIPTDDKSLLAYLNSKVAWFLISNEATLLRGGFVQLLGRYIETLPVPNSSGDQKATLGRLAERAQAAAEQRYALQQEVTRRIPDLADDPASAKLTKRLHRWWALPDFAAFQKEVKKSLKADIPLKERNEWDSWISENRSRITALSAEVSSIEDEINAKVYALFDLTPEEIALLEANI